MSVIRSSALSNGVKVITKHLDWPTVALGVHLRSGSSFETQETNGTAHFIEHMLFKGTATQSYSQLVETVENMGAHMNAYTTRDHTMYSARCLPGDTEQVTGILSDIVQHPLFDSNLVENERSTIVAEGESVASVAEETLYDVVHAHVFSDHPLGMTVLGPKANIQGMTRDKLVSFSENHCDPRSLTLLAAGDVDHDKLCELAEASFQQPSPSSARRVVSPAHFHAGSSRVARVVKSGTPIPPMPVSHVAITFAGVPPQDAEYGAVSALSPLLSLPSTMSGARELLLGFRVHNVTYANNGFISIYCAVPTAKVDDLLKQVGSAVKSLTVAPDLARTLVDSAKVDFHVRTGAYTFVTGLSSAYTLFGDEVIGSPGCMDPLVRAIERADQAALSSRIKQMAEPEQVQITVMDDVSEEQFSRLDGEVYGAVGFGGVRSVGGPDLRDIMLG
ncbi:Mitochondrial processing peptidase beta subunit [Carpediemonas membranifera]|uniref:Alpha-MPP n=1 Tax=Carpediemonas membranifera TaxID=201153 RepID=A0A8J6AWV7_9EUKA|nr:Mitochondrial processing peptidase beta subunit [Carpediemonas membranifera]|eukprot:KAG9394505.1 Mitochondrial processing peptidase beta subunit [Carpediemonas membranifera]